jgi:phosphoribosylanthranilate isomerase
MNLKIKICGMREPENIRDVAELRPDLMGFIFFPHSPRDAGQILNQDVLAELPKKIRKTGVFVNEDIETIAGIVRKYSLDIVQLHGNETQDQCRKLREKEIPVIKVFNIKDSSSLRLCYEYQSCTEYFLFDTSTPKYGGSGNKFDWKILDEYNLDHPFILSGGISPDDISNILAINNPSFYGIDINSRFEIKPGIKNIETLKLFISEIRLYTNTL